MKRTLNDIRPTHKLSDHPKSVTTKQQLTYSKNPETACVIPEGTELEVYFSEARPEKIYFDYAGALRCVTLANAHKYVTGFAKPPGMRTLERYSFDGIAKSVTGARVEPDGYGPDGSPSWLLCLGLI
jgi:hypothetical protein